MREAKQASDINYSNTNTYIKENGQFLPSSMTVFLHLSLTAGPADTLLENGGEYGHIC
jgi:hypothetical protein